MTDFITGSTPDHRATLINGIKIPTSDNPRQRHKIMVFTLIMGFYIYTELCRYLQVD